MSIENFGSDKGPLAKMSAYRKEATQKIIEMIKAGTAPWMKPWEPGLNINKPCNGLTGHRYRGFNNIYLNIIQTINGYTDPRWYTFKQITQIKDVKLQKGSKGTRIEFWQWEEKDKEESKIAGKSVYIPLNKPRRMEYVVFNAAQIDGLEPLKMPEITWEPNVRAEQIIASVGVKIQHTQEDRAFYNRVSDTINLPARSSFKSDDKYYSTSLHELGHSTGHESRLNRNLSGAFGSPEYAKEELCAELASYFLGQDVGIRSDGLDQQHAAYIESWAKALEKDPNEIFRAAATAEKICDYLYTKENEYLKINKANINTPEKKLSLTCEKLLSTGMEKSKVSIVAAHEHNVPLADAISAVTKISKSNRMRKTRNKVNLREREL